jgi:hypothetical protein
VRGLLRRTPGGARGLFLCLDTVPDFLDVGGREVAVLVGEDMGMAADHLAGDGFDDVAEGERVLLFRHLGVIDDLEQ